jgi:hypothetical protein
VTFPGCALDALQTIPGQAARSHASRTYVCNRARQGQGRNDFNPAGGPAE